MRRGRFIKMTTFVTIGCIFLFLAFLPSFLSTKRGTELLISLINRRIPGKISMDRMALSWFGPMEIQGFSLKDPQGKPVITFDSYLSETPLALQLLKKGPVRGKTSLHSLQAIIYREGTENRTNLHSALGFYFRLPNLLSPLSLIDVDAELDIFSKLNEWTFKTSGSIECQDLSGTFDVNLKNREGGILTLNAPAVLHMTLSPLFLKQVTGHSFGYFLNPLSLDLTLHELALPAKIFSKNCRLEDMQDLSMAADIRCPKVKWKNTSTSEEAIVFNTVAITIKSPKQAEYFAIEVEGLHDVKEKPVKFLFDFQWNKSFLIEEMRHGLLMPTRFSVKHIPSSLIDECLGSNDYVSHILGKDCTLQLSMLKDNFETVRVALHSEKLDIPTMVINIHHPFYWLTGEEIQGSFSGNMESKELAQSGKINGKFSLTHTRSSKKSSIHVTLSKTLVEFPLSPDAGKKILAPWIPVFDEFMSAEHPIKLKISHASFPLSPFDFKNFQIDQSSLSLGKLHFHHKGIVEKMVDIFRPGQPKTIPIWTTPLYFSLKEGVLTTKRMDMLLLNRYNLALWGRADLINDHMKMVLGLTGQALELAFHIKGLKKDMILQIPIQGKVSNPQLDYRKAKTKIGTLLAKQSTGGAVLGMLLGLFSGKDSPAPLQTTYPFPWEQSQRPLFIVKNPKQPLIPGFFEPFPQREEDCLSLGGMCYPSTH